MKAHLKPFFLLSTLVLTIYVMRHGDISVGSMVKRFLQEYRPSASLCTGTSLDQVYSESEINRAKSFKESLQSMRGGNPMKDLLLSGDVSTQGLVDYLMGALAFIVPWAVMFILSILSAIVITCNWCCIYGCCKNTKCCKCCKEPKDSSKKRIYIFITAIFGLAGIGSGIAGIIMASGVPKGIELTMCSVIAIAEDLTYGVLPQHWLGIEGALDSIDDLIANFNTVKTSLSQSSASITDVTTAKDDVLTKLDTMITNLDVAGNKNFVRPDPNESTYTSLYISNLKPKSTDSTMTGMIRAEVELKNSILTTAKTEVNNAIDTIQNGNIMSDIQSGRDAVAEQSENFQNALKSVGDFGSIGKSAITGIGAGLTAIFAATLTFSIFAIGAMIMVGLLKMKSFNKFLHSSWMGFTLMSVFGFLLSTILYPLSLVLMETCDVVQLALDDSDTMAQLTGNALRDSPIGEYINLCMYGDGDIVQYLELDETLADFWTINDQFVKIENAGMPIENSAPPSLTLAYQDDLIAGTKIGKYWDAVEVDADLATLNKTVNHNTNGCIDIYDTYALNSVNCTSDKGTIFESTSAVDFNLGSPTCIGFDIFSAASGNTGANRYTTRFQSCGNVAYVNNFVSRFQNNRVVVSNLYTNIRTELDPVQTSYDTMADKIKVVLNSFVTIQNQLNSVNAALYDDATGLFKNMNCKFLKTGVDRLSDSMCVGFISSLYQASVVIIICSVMSFFGAIFTFCLAKRFILEDPNSKPKPV